MQRRASDLGRARVRAALTWGGFVLLGALALPSVTRADVRVQTRDGVSFALPADFRELKAPSFAASLPGTFERAYADAATPAVQVIIATRSVQRQSSLPLRSAEVTRSYRDGFLAGAQGTLRLTEIYDVGDGAYEPERSAFSMQFKTRGPSYADRLLSEPDASANWTEIRRTGADPLQLRCVLGQLLGGEKSASLAQLQAREALTARACGWSAERVAQYVRETGAAAFSPIETANTSIAFFTRDASVQVMVVAPLARALAVQQVAAQLLASSQIDAAVKLEASIFHDFEELSPFGLGRLFGAVLGSAAIVIVLAVTFALLLRKLGLSASGAMLCALVLVVLAMSGLVISAALREQALSVFALLQLASYLATGLISRRPLSRWLEGRASVPA